MKIVLAYSGGLDTSVLVSWLKEHYSAEIITFAADVGQEEELDGLEAKAKATGASKHYTLDLVDEFASDFIFPMMRANALYEGQYLLGTSIARPLIAKAHAEIAEKEGADAVAHGATGKGNDQVRFDLSIRAHGNFNIVTPIREIQNITENVRTYEENYLKDKGFYVSALHKKYSVNENLMGATVSGSEIDKWEEPSEESFVLCKLPENYPNKITKLDITFSKGEVTSITGSKSIGPEILRDLNALGGSYGIGRTVFTGDTIIGLKGRFVFEAPGISILMAAHRALEESVLTDRQNVTKTQMGQEWVNLVYKGFYFEPLRENIEAFLKDSQKNVSGEVTVVLGPGRVDAVAVRSENILSSNDGIYAQSASWTEAESQGFIKLIGQSAATWSSIHTQK